jgi:acetyl esterase/lipase
MQILRIISISLLLSLATACSNGNGNNFEFDSRPPLELTLSDLPAALSDTGADFAQDVPYGEGERNLFDIYLPDCDEPTGLVIYIHGGGFTGGDKSSGRWAYRVGKASQ